MLNPLVIGGIGAGVLWLVSKLQADKGARQSPAVTEPQVHALDGGREAITTVTQEGTYVTIAQPGKTDDQRGVDLVEPGAIFEDPDTGEISCSDAAGGEISCRELERRLLEAAEGGGMASELIF